MINHLPPFQLLAKPQTYYLGLVLLFLFPIVGWTQVKNRTVYGQVMDAETDKPLNNITLVNGRTGQRSVSNEKGTFFIWAAVGDSILVRAVGYKDTGIRWDGASNRPEIKVKQQAIPLSELVVKGKRPEQLRAEIDAFLANPQGATQLRNETLKKMIATQGLSQPGIGVSIDALYELWSKEGRSKRKVAELQMQDLEKYYASMRYSPALVQQLTGLSGERLDDFMSFCSLNEQFILRATDYELHYQILSCYRRFQ